MFSTMNQSVKSEFFWIFSFWFGGVECFTTDQIRRGTKIQRLRSRRIAERGGRFFWLQITHTLGNVSVLWSVFSCIGRSGERKDPRNRLIHERVNAKNTPLVPRPDFLSDATSPKDAHRFVENCAIRGHVIWARTNYIICIVVLKHLKSQRRKIHYWA